MVGPSPVTSNGTETTEIDDEEQSEPGDETGAAETGGPRQVGSFRCSNRPPMLINDRVAQDAPNEYS